MSEKGGRDDSGAQPAAPRWWALGFVGVVFAAAAVGAYHQATRPFHVPQRAPQAFAVHLVDHVPQDAVVESWEWELDVLADLRYHHPDTVWVDRYAARLQFGDPIGAEYDPLVHAPAYLVDGPFSKWTGIYATFLAGGCCELLHSEGPYDLYRVAHHAR